MISGTKNSTQVFKPFFSRSSANRQGVQEDKAITSCMNELFHVLEAGYASQPEIQSFMHYTAILGSTARLIEALLKSKEPKIKEIFNVGFLYGVRTVIYHVQEPFKIHPQNLPLLCEPQNPKILVFFSHIYEHCRNELYVAFGDTQLAQLSRPIIQGERDDKCFKNAVEYGIEYSHSLGSENKERVLSQLKRNRARLGELLKFIDLRPNALVHRLEDLQKADIVKASSVATIITWMGIGASSLLKATPMQLDENELRFVLNTYKEYIDPGIKYRHKNKALSDFLQKYSICSNLIIPNKLELGLYFVSLAAVGDLNRVQQFFSALRFDKDLMGWANLGLAHAAKNGHKELVLWFLDNPVLTFHENTLIGAMREAAEQSHMEITRLLISRAGFEIEGTYDYPSSWGAHKPTEMLLLRNLRVSEQSPYNYVPISIPSESDAVDHAAIKLGQMRL